MSNKPKKKNLKDSKWIGENFLFVLSERKIFIIPKMIFYIPNIRTKKKNSPLETYIDNRNDRKFLFYTPVTPYEQFFFSYFLYEKPFSSPSCFFIYSTINFVHL